MKISIITVCKNSEKFIETAIQSVVSQSYPEIEHIVIDGQSSDRTVEILKRQTSISQLISEPDSGVYQAMNKGIRLATGDFIFFLNSDDYLVDRTVIEDVVRFIASQPSCDFVYGEMEVRPPNGGQPTVLKPKPPEQLLQALIFLDGPQHPVSFFKRDLFDKLGYFDESYKIASDYEWFLRLAQNESLSIHYYPRVINSFSSGGLSNHSQKQSLIELFAAQNQAPIYQTPKWIDQRIHKFQDLVIDLHEMVQHQANHIQNQANHIQNQTSHIQNQASQLQEQANHIQNQANHIQNQAISQSSDPDNIMVKNRALRQQLANLIQTANPASVQVPIQAPGIALMPGVTPIKPLLNVNVVVAPNEINQRHGTGILIKRIFPDSTNIISIRSVNSYGGDHSFGNQNVCLSYSGRSRAEIFSMMLQTLNGSTIRQILCVPYLVDDLWSAIALKELSGAPLCSYILDDNNIYSNHIPNDLMRELLQKSDLRLAISPEIRDAYENKYNVKFWLLPPLLPKQLIRLNPTLPTSPLCRVKTGVLIGNVWSPQWLELLQKTLRGSGIKIDWYPNPGQTPDQASALQADGLNVQAEQPGEQLAPLLSDYPYAIMPTGCLDQNEALPEIARLSLPSRLIFLIATASLPIIVLGSRETGAAHFVERFEIGVVCDYSSESFVRAVERVCDPVFQQKVRQNCAAMAVTFASDEIEQWIWRSLQQGEPCDLRFETLIPKLPNSLYPFLEAPVPQELWGDFILLYQVVRRLKHQGFNPDYVIDVGASMGTWSHAVNLLLPDARYILVEPLASRYDQAARNYYIGTHPNFEVMEVAVSDREGMTSFQVSPDLAGSSLLRPKDFRAYETVEIRVATLDNIAQEKGLTGRGFLKIDVQCAEHLVLQGAKQLLTHIDVVAMELSLPRYDENAKIYVEMLQLMDQIGFRYYDDIGSWRSPVDGTLLQRDVLFVRQELFPTVISA